MSKVEKTSVSVVVPVYNSEEALPELIRRLTLVLPQCADSSEIILVNDASADGSWEIIQQLAEANPAVIGLDLMRNYGQHNALLAGILKAQYETIVTLDDDLQNPPEEMPKLLEKLAEGHDVVYGTPTQEEHGLWRDMASRLTKMTLQGIMGVQAARNVSAYRAFRASAREAFANYRGADVSIDVLLTWGASRFAAVAVEHKPRQLGRSNYTFRKLARHALNMMTGFSVLPLRVASLFGFAFTFFGFLILCYVLYGYFFVEGNVEGFPFLASIIAIFSGIQLFSLGVIGEYIGRTHQRSLDRPSFVVERETR